MKDEVKCSTPASNLGIDVIETNLLDMVRKEHKSIEPESMPEAEVTLRLAFWLLNRADQESHADIAIDGAHVRIARHERQLGVDLAG